MEVNTSAEEACKDADLEQAVLSAKAKVANVSESAVTVQCIAGGDSSSRRLAESIRWNYQITVSSEDQASDVVVLIAAKNQTVLAEEITGFLPANSQLLVMVTEMTTATVTVVTVTTTTTRHEHGGPGDDEDFLDDSHAHTPAALGAVAMAMITATLTLSH